MGTMATTPMAAVNAHTEAINSKSRDQLAESVWFPFLHMQPDGTKGWFETASDLPDASRAPFSRTEIQSLEMLATSGDFTLFALTFQRYDDKDEPSLLVQGLWGLHRVEDEWKVGWRQYLGEI
jgi:hypothetical protein